MRSSRNDSSSKALWVVGILVLLAGGGVTWMLMSGESGPAPAPPAVAVQQPADTSAPPEFKGSSVPDSTVVKPIDIPAVTQHVRTDLPAVASGGPTGCIEGFAVNAQNFPVEGVTITLFIGNPILTGAFPGTRQPVNASTTSGPDGSFRLCDVPVARNYVVVGEQDKYAHSEANGFTVDKDKVTSGVVLHMSEGAVIHGVVSQLDGGPLSGARVELYYTLVNAFLKPEEQKPAQVVFTDGQGRYAFIHVSAESLRVAALSDGFATQTHNISYALEAGPKDQEVNFTLDIGGSLAGRVVSSGGTSIADARVEASSLAKENQGTALAISDAGGYFVLNGMSRDPYQLHCTAPGYSDKTIPGVDISVGNYTIVLDKQGGVTGWVTNVANVPVPQFTLHLMRSHVGAEPNYLNDSRDFSSPEGKFDYAGIDPGTYVLEARADNFADTRSEEFTIERDAAQEPQLRVRMLRGGTLKGHVLDAAGKALAGAVVSLNPNNFIDSSIAKIFKAIAPSDERECKVRSSEDGSYVIAHITPGSYQLVAEHESSASRIVNDVRVVDDDAGGNAPVDLSLPRGSSISGRAIDDTSVPLPFCKVQINTNDNSYIDAGTTDREGYFTFANLRQGTYHLTINPERLHDAPIHPFIRLVIASRSIKDVYVGEGQTVDGVLIQLKQN
jgi:Carboxypeptidase regulatory-like domain